MPFWQHAAIAGAAILVIVIVKLFDRASRRFGWGVWLHELLGDWLAGIVMRLAFVGLVGLAAWGAQFLGFVVPDEIEQFIPSEMTSLIVAVLAASAFGTGAAAQKSKAAEVPPADDGEI